MVKWEYRVLVIKSGWGARLKERHEEDLNALGQEGWELAGMAAEGAVMSMVFKRPIPQGRASRQRGGDWPAWS